MGGDLSDDPVIELSNIQGFPVVAVAVRILLIPELLDIDIGHVAAEINEGLGKLAQWPQDALSLFDRPNVVPAEHDVAPSMGRFRVDLRMGGDDPTDRDQVDLIWRRVAEVAEEPQRPLSCLTLTIV